MYTFTLHLQSPLVLRMVIRSSGCMNGYGQDGSMVSYQNSTHVIDITKNPTGRCYDFNRVSGASGSVPGEFLAFGWVHDTLVSTTADQSSGAIYLAETASGFLQNLWATVYNNHCFKNHNPNYQASVTPKHRKRENTPNEKIIQDFFDYGGSWSYAPSLEGLVRQFGAVSTNSSNAYCGLYQFLRKIVTASASVGFDLVGSDRKAGFCVAYLMSFRNISYALSEIDKSRDMATRTMSHEIIKYLLAPTRGGTGGPIDGLFCLSLINHHGSDNEIFGHAGVNVEVTGVSKGFWALEKFCPENTLAHVRRYYKGNQSQNFRDGANKYYATLGTPKFSKVLGYEYGGFLRNPLTMDTYSMCKKLVSKVKASYQVENGAISHILSYFDESAIANAKILDDLLKGKSEDALSQEKLDQLKKKSVPFKNWVANIDLTAAGGLSRAIQADDPIDENGAPYF